MLWEDSQLETENYFVVSGVSAEPDEQGELQDDG